MTKSFCRYANHCWRRQTIDGGRRLPEKLQLKLVSQSHLNQMCWPSLLKT